MSGHGVLRKASDERCLRIAFVTQPWDQILPSRGGCDGSIAIVTQEMATRLARQGHHVCVYGAGQPFDLRQHVEHAQGLEFRTLPVARLELKLFNIYDKAANRLSNARQADRPRYASKAYLAAYGWQLAREIRQNGYDIVHVHNLFQIVPAIRAVNPSVRIVLHMHCEWLSQIAPEVIAKYLAHVDTVVGVSEHITGKVRKRFPARAQSCRTLHNGVDIEAFGVPDGQEHQRDNSARRLLFVGRISPEKGVHLLIEAFAKVHQAFPDAVLDIVGPPAQVSYEFLVGLDECGQLAELAKFYEAGKATYFEQVKARTPPELASKVNFLGAVPYRQIAAHYRKAAVFVNASYSDAFGLPLIEAMANGLPVVGASVGGVKEIVIHNKTGILFDVGNAGMLAEGIVRLLRDDRLRKAMGDAGRQRVIEAFSWERTVESLVREYREMLQ